MMPIYFRIVVVLDCVPACLSLGVVWTLWQVVSFQRAERSYASPAEEFLVLSYESCQFAAIISVYIIYHPALSKLQLYQKYTNPLPLAYSSN